MELINDSELMDVTEDQVVKSLVDDQVTITDIENCFVSEKSRHIFHLC